MPITQQHRMLAMDTALGPNVVGLRRIFIQESLSRLFVMEAELSSEHGEVKFEEIVGNNATVRLELDGKKTRYFNGYVSRFVQVGNEGGYARYRATLVPWLWLLTRTSDCRIFQDKTAPEIIEEVFKAHGMPDYQLKLSGKYEKWEYCVQYRETDFNFVSRLMEEEGIYYYFQHLDGKHILAIADSSSAHKAVSGYEEIVFHEVESTARDREVISEWVVEKEVQPVAYAVSDFNFETPKTPLRSSASVSREHGSAKFEMFDYPGVYGANGEGDRLAQVRLDELQSQHEILRGESSARGLTPGSTFKLKKHARKDQNREYLITGISVQADAGEFASLNKAEKEGEFFTCSFTSVDATQTFRAGRLTPKPSVQGPQTALVVGPKGEEIYTDKYGRVKVQFHWDRYGKGDENASCWIRVAQAWAGKQWGALYVPRIGQEVIVDFLEGDPDQPIITGCVYNATAMPPYALPGNATVSTLKSNSSKGGSGFNELRFEDKKGGEQIFIHAEKNTDTRVKHDAKTWIGNEDHLIVKKNQFELIEGSQHSTIGGDRLAKIGGDHGETIKGDHLISLEGSEHYEIGGDQVIKIKGDANLKVVGDLNEEIGGKLSTAASDIHARAKASFAMHGTDVHILGAGTVIIESGTQISLKVGGSFVDISPSGVSISGPIVLVNSGGAAGSGGGCSPAAPMAPEAPDPPALPLEADKADTGGLTPLQVTPGEKEKGSFGSIDISPAAQVLQDAADAGAPFCEECARAAAAALEPGETLAVISSVAWLDGANDKEIAAATQWVNLPREAKWVDVANDVANIDRLGPKLRYKVTFSKPGAHAFKVKADPGEDNVTYTPGEEGRNANFKWMKDEKSYTTEGDGTKIVETDFFISAAGGDKFKLLATDTNNNPAVESGEIATKRLVYIVPIKMTGMTTAAALATLKAEFEKQGITLVELAAAEIDRMPNIGPTESDAYETKCKTAFNGSTGKAKLPYAVAIGFTEHLAVKNSNQVLELPGVEVGPGKPAADLPVMAVGLRDGDGRAARSLWKDLVPGESWFVSASFTPDGGGAAIAIPEAKCAALPVGASDCGTVRVDVTGLAAATGTVKVTVNVVDRMRGGLSFSGGNLVCICTKAWWTDTSSREQNTTAIHEMGHKVGMVAKGTGKLPDKVSTFYEDKGHVGPHCYFDLGELDTYADSSGNKCVMFGAVGADTHNAFCENCVPAVRKVDLSAGWTV